MEEDAMSASDLMTSNPVTVTPDTSVAEVWDLMRERGIRHVPIVDGAAVVGMVSDRDLAHFDLGRVLTAEGAEAVRRELGIPIVKFMSTDVVTVEPDAELAEVIDLLLEYRIGAVPVVQSESGDLVGIISYIDVLHAVRDAIDEG
jgi:acetoin utilization protein AcuB